MDTVIKSGEVLYSNVLYCNALASFAEISKDFNKSSEAEHFQFLHDLARQKINERFWNGQFYADWVSGRKKYNYFDTAGNLLAIYFNIADKDRSLSILNFIAKQKDKLPKTNYPAYPIWRLSPTRFLSLSLGYHNHDYIWLWIGCFYALALNKAGFAEKAKSALQQVAGIIAKHGRVYEVYQGDTPVKKFLFKAESPFAWSAGMYIYAYSKLAGP
jgi:glycogen debranching enzyme